MEYLVPTANQDFCLLPFRNSSCTVLAQKKIKTAEENVQKQSL